MKIDVIGVPFKYGCGRDGVQFAPDSMRHFSLIEEIKNSGIEVYDLGNQYIAESDKYNRVHSSPTMKNLELVCEVNRNLAEVVYDSIQGGGFPLSIGGDHSIALGSCSGASRCFDRDLGVIWVDAHGDINTAATSPSGNIHGMALASLMGYGDPSLVNIYFEGSKVDRHNIALVGVRSLDKGEEELIDEENLCIYTIEEIRKRGFENMICSLKGFITAMGVKNLHLSVDVDSVDPRYAPGTGTMVENGLTVDELLRIVDTVFSAGHVRSADIVELNPLLDAEDSRTSKLCVEVASRIARNVAANRK